MLKVDINRKTENPDSVMARGDIAEITVEVAAVINALYTQFNLKAPPVAEAFRCALTELVTLPDSPLWEAQGNHIGICISKKKQEDTDG